MVEDDACGITLLGVQPADPVAQIVCWQKKLEFTTLQQARGTESVSS
jgi:hypothetical protein